MVTLGRTRSAWLLAACIAIGPTLAPSPAGAQNSEVVARLVDFGRMPRRSAEELVSKVSAALGRNAARGGERYDTIRQRVGRVLFDGPGRSRDEYTRRLAQVMAKMQSGLDAALLTGLFVSGPNASVMCASDFGVTVSDCDALIAAAIRQRATLSYLPPDDGSAVRRGLREAGVSREVSDAVVEALFTTMVGVPRNLTRDVRGQGILALLEACPGGLTQRESQVRAWHVGPTEGLAHCIVQSLLREGPANAQGALELRFEMNSAAAQALVRWHDPAAARALGDQWMEQGRAHFAGGRFAQAVLAYRQASEAAPDNARAYAGLGTSLLRTDDARGAVAAFRSATRLAPTTANFHAMLGQALEATSDRTRAGAAYAEALRIDPAHQGARAAFARLGITRMPREAQRALNADELRARALGHFQARRFQEAAQDYQAAAELDPNNARLYAGLGAARLALGNGAGAVEAYENAVFLAPDSASFQVALARARLGQGNTEGAVTAVREALRLEPSNGPARQLVSQLGVELLREAPTREEIIQTLRPLQRAIAACQPTFHGVVAFQIKIDGPRGQVTEVSMGPPLAGTPEGECMAGVVRGVVFPRFGDASFQVGYPYQL